MYIRNLQCGKVVLSCASCGSETHKRANSNLCPNNKKRKAEVQELEVNIDLGGNEHPIKKIKLST